MWRAFLILFTVSLVSGCGWLQYRGDAQGSRSNRLESQLSIATLPNLSTAWTAPVGATTDPVVRGSRVFVTGGKNLWALDTGSGQILYTVATTAHFGDEGYRSATTGGPGLDGVVYASERWFYSFNHGSIAEAGGLTRVLDAKTGSVLDTLAPSGLPPIENNGWRYVIHNRENICCQFTTNIEATRGASTFRVNLLTFAMVVDDSFVYSIAQFGTHQLAVFPAAGCGAPTCTPSWWKPANPDVLASPLTLGRHFVFTAGGSGLYAFARGGCGAGMCTEAWRVPMTGITGFAVDKDVLIVTRGSTVEGYAEAGCGASTCSPLWTATVTGTLTAPSIANHVVYAGSTDGFLRAWSTTGCGTPTCTAAWSSDQRGNVGPVSINDHALYFAVGSTQTTTGGLRKLLLHP